MGRSSSNTNSNRNRNRVHMTTRQATASKLVHSTPAVHHPKSATRFPPPAIVAATTTPRWRRR